MRYLQPSGGADDGRASSFVQPSDTVNARVLAAAGTAELSAIPDGARYVGFAATADFFALFGDDEVVAILPAADVTNGTAPELNPGMRAIPEGATHISLVTPTAGAIVTLSYWG